ncbi:6-pyruvoyl trahydropterin synthase family protein [Kineococcus sp. SYSU DK004]|uniref:6-pyruvoyl trahydropterin synthase family protein n=1 Tax=Kineococcus sp. SYSU DK004 TaxID=3383125 RepID=UPI003D7D06CD
MYSLTVRDRVMVAHSLPGEVFGPAQALHGATFVVEATFRRRELDPDGLVVDIGAAAAALSAELGRIGYRNLDEVEEFRGRTTTTEFLCGWLADRLADAVAAGSLGPHAAGLDSLHVLLRESDVAWGAYERSL